MTKPLGYVIFDEDTRGALATGYHPQTKLYHSIGKARSAASSSLWARGRRLTIRPVYIGEVTPHKEPIT